MTTVLRAHFDVTTIAGPGESGRGQPHSKTLSRKPTRHAVPRGFGVRLSSAAFRVAVLRCVSAVLLCLLALMCITTTFAAEKSTDAKNIQGTWLPVEAQLGGAPMKEEVLKMITLKLDSGKYEVTAENVDKGTYTMDPAARPRIIDIIGTEGPNVGKKIPAIYELHGDTLRLCYGLGGGPRPTEFKSPGGTKVFLVTYKRKKPAA